MCKYINFNNLRKKKGFVGGGVVVGWNSPLYKHKKQLRKHKKKEKKTRKTIYYLNSEKTIKTSFYYYQKNGFWKHGKYKKQKHIPFPKQVFCVFCFQEQKTVLENRNRLIFLRFFLIYYYYYLLLLPSPMKEEGRRNILKLLFLLSLLHSYQAHYKCCIQVCKASEQGVILKLKQASYFDRWKMRVFTSPKFG